ncbi:MAG: hypothetical protein JWO78_77 [Micavibrio sp.]|nr:hypothetical protein [Micavibrio sp.]
MVNCHATGYNDMLHEHGHVLNALMTAMIERGMGAPDPFNTAISAALRAQKQFQDISRTRLMQTMDRIATEKWDDKKYNDSSKQNEQKWR